jgi:hypothetical protein
VNVKSRYTIVGIIMALALSVVAIIPVFAAGALTSGAITLTVQKTAGGVTAEEATVGNTLYVSNSAFNDVKIDGIAVDDASTSARTATVTNLNTAATVSVVLTDSGSTANIPNVTPTTVGTVYTGQLIVGTTTVAGTTIAAVDGNIIKVTFSTDSANVTVDASGPVVTLTTPAKSTNTRATTIDFTGSVTDSGSGLRADSSTSDLDADGVYAEPLTVAAGTLADVEVQIDNATITGIVAGTSLAASENSDRPLWTAVTDGYSFAFAKVLAAGTHSWYMTATDRVGNQTITDSDSAVLLKQSVPFTVDNVAAKMSEAKTGIGHNQLALTAALETVNSSSVRVTFTDDGLTTGTADNIDGTTVAISDFLVSGNTVTSVYTKTNKVYLGLGTALGAAEKPTVSLVGSVNDSAGNPVTIDNITSVDGIKPTVTIGVAGGTATGRALATGVATTGITTITVTADELLNAVPTVRISPVSTGPVTGTADTAGLTMTLTAGTTATYTGSFTSAAAGLRTVYASTVDKAGNTGTAGKGSADAEALTLSLATLFEIDNAIPAAAVTLTPSTTATNTQSSGPFIRIDFPEGTENQIGGVDSISQGTPSVATEVDSHNSVTLTALALDGVSILGSEGVVDTNSFIYKATDLAVGAHILLWSAKDEAGNVLTGSTTTDFNFTVSARPAYSVPLSPGWNLISLPGDPTDTAIDTVLPAAHPATSVLTYDPNAVNGPWLVASRAADGSWTGTLSTIDSSHAYWVNTTAFNALSTLIPERDPAAVLPTIAVKAGWNLLPVVDLSLSAAGGGPGGVDTTAVAYLNSVTWNVAYSFDTQASAWTKLTSTSGNVVNGKGYWTWITKDGTLVP